MGWRTARKLRRVRRLIVSAVASAEKHPLEDPGWRPPGHYRMTDLHGRSWCEEEGGDTPELARVRRKLRRGPGGWRTEATEDARILRDISGVVEEWAHHKDRSLRQFRDYSDRVHREGDGMLQRDEVWPLFLAITKVDRDALVIIDSLLGGKSLDEIPARQSGTGAGNETEQTTREWP